MIACHECDLLQHTAAPPPGGAMRCRRCGATLRRNRRDSLRRALACQLGAALLFVVSVSFPIVAMEIQGQRTVATLIGAALALKEQGQPAVAILVFVTTVLGPALQIGGMLYMLAPLHWGRELPGFAFVFRFVQSLRQWGMIEVFILGVLVSLVKLAGIARVVPGIAMWSFAGLVILLAAAAVHFEPADVWERIDKLRRRSRAPQAIGGVAS